MKTAEWDGWGIMRSTMRLGFAAAMVLASAMSIPAQGQVARVLNFGDNPEPVTVASAGLEVLVQPTKPDADGLISTQIALRAPGIQSTIVEVGSTTSASYDRWIGIMRLQPSDPVPTMIFQSFTGGAHCCATLTAAVPVAGRFKLVEFEAIDGDFDKALPTDLDRDGLVDFVRQDDSFRYQFSSGAGSFSPPRVYNIYKGQLIDVSEQHGFRALWQRFAAQTLAACKDKANEDRNGACAAYVAAGARLGIFESAMKTAVSLANPSGEMPSPCQVALVDYQCPAGKEIKFYTFQSALTWFLRTEKYID